MRWLVLVLTLVAAAAAAHFSGVLPVSAYAGKLPTALQPAALQPTAPQLFRWKDAKGQVVYGTQPPAGVKAEAVADKGTMSTVPATKIPEPPKQELPPGVTIQQLMTERAIEQATGGK